MCLSVRIDAHSKPNFLLPCLLPPTPTHQARARGGTTTARTTKSSRIVLVMCPHTSTLATPPTTSMFWLQSGPPKGINRRTTEPTEALDMRAHTHSTPARISPLLRPLSVTLGERERRSTLILSLSDEQAAHAFSFVELEATTSTEEHYGTRPTR